MKAEIFRSTVNGQFYFRLVASNGEKIAQSEGYVDVRDAEHTLNLILDNANTCEIAFVGEVETL